MSKRSSILRALVWPCAAASLTSRSASARSCAPPWSLPCMLPSISFAVALPRAAASSNSRLASAKSSEAPPS
eukprot:scaffold55253_cov61-Phaeocystis_antarctica.AAC.30